MTDDTKGSTRMLSIIKHNLATALSIILLGAAIGWWLSPRGEAPPEPPTVVIDTRDATLTPFDYCPTENGPGPCYWDADTQGNGKGVDVLNGYRVLACGPRWEFLVRAKPMWDEGCQRDKQGKPIALRAGSTIRVMEGER